MKGSNRWRRLGASSLPDAVDLRRGFDGLATATRGLVGESPLSGHLFVFLNRRKNRIKLLVWGRTGYPVLYKRLERGSFELFMQPAAGRRHIEVDAGELERLRRRRRA